MILEPYVVKGLKFYPISFCWSDFLHFRLVGANELGGHAEMAISKSKEFRGGCETPSSEPGMDLLDLWDLEDDDTNGYVFGDPNGGGDGTASGQHPQVGPQVTISVKNDFICTNGPRYLRSCYLRLCLFMNRKIGTKHNLNHFRSKFSFCRFQGFKILSNIISANQI